MFQSMLYTFSDLEPRGEGSSQIRDIDILFKDQVWKIRTSVAIFFNTEI